ncbi:MAG: carboxypeptidase-like regulatory domain-containing protein, partial [Bacteroidota bacterium]|nr:carboxypeptidase-like regulatory domain-containing protein [Bacteroidota bacterium]
MKRIVLIAIVFIAAFSLNAQNKIEGKVLELSKDGSVIPVFRANVYWEGTSVGTTTDINGDYSIDEAESFPATLSVSYVGYTVDTNVFINNKYVFYLKSSVDLDEVDVEGRRNTTNTSLIAPINIQTLSTGEIQKAACCNLSECFETNNSVDVSYSDAMTGIKKIQMLGLDGSYVQITSELMPLVRGLQRSYGLTYIPGSWIESIQIIKGSGSVVNGYESLTGQINVEYFKSEEDVDKFKWNTYVNHSGKLENNLILTKKKGDWRSNLFTHISYFDREVDNHGFHHKGDNFLDMPKLKQVSILN